MLRIYDCSISANGRHAEAKTPPGDCPVMANECRRMEGVGDGGPSLQLQ